MELLDNADTDGIRTITIENSFRLACGQSREVAISVFPDNPEITWTSSDPAIVSVLDGLVTAHAPGSAVITASVGSLSADVTVTTFLTAESFVLNVTEHWMIAKDTVDLCVEDTAPAGAETSIRWSSSDTTVATVSADGRVTTKKPSDADVIICATDAFTGIHQQAVLHVCFPVTAVAFDTDAATVKAGMSLGLVAHVTMNTQTCDNHLVVFTSSDETVAVVSADGVVAGISPGTATITASAVNDASIFAACTVTVTQSRILILPASLTAIESEAFAGLPNVEAIRIPAGVTSIAPDAFDPGMTLIVPAESPWVQWAEDNGYIPVSE